jgi:hypothetical protein
MRITIKHRDQPVGILGQKRKYLLDISIDFSQEERAIIETRKLYETYFDLSPGFLASSVVFVPTSAIKACLITSPFLFLSGCVVGIASLFTGDSGFGSFLVFLSFAALGFGLYAAYFMRHGYRTEITIGEMLGGFSVLTFSPPAAKDLDAELRQRLVGLKEFLTDSTELVQTETFEI